MAFIDDIQTLVNAGIDVSKVRTPAYARRLASGVKKAEQQGRKAPTRTELRGHARVPVEHLPKDGHRLEQHRIQNPTAMADLANLLRRARKPGAGKDYLIVVSGLVSKYPHATIGEAGIPKTVSRRIAAAGLQKEVKANKDGDYLDLLAWANGLLDGVEWIAIYSISVAYPDNKGK